MLVSNGYEFHRIIPRIQFQTDYVEGRILLRFYGVEWNLEALQVSPLV